MKRKRRFISRVLRGILFAHLAFWAVIALLCVIYSFINPPLTPLMVQRYLVRGYDWHKRHYIALENIPPSTVKMAVMLEDGNYYRHFGFEVKMLKEAWQRNQKSGKIRFGGSTISNQLARTIFLTTDRNYLRKYLEIQATVIMEAIMTKDRMLELYLNYVEWGQGIYGIDTASRHYFGTGCRNLGRDQSMRLISILTTPIKYSPQHLSASARQRYRMLQRYF